MISDITDDIVSFYPVDFRKNSYEKNELNTNNTKRLN